MKLSIIILNYKVPHHLLLCLQSVSKALKALNAEIIVVDNCSEDDSVGLVKKYFPEVVLIQNNKNVGFSKGNNRGVDIAKGEYICLLNPDTVVVETVFETMLSFAETHSDAGAIGIRMIDGTGNFLPESKRNIPVPKIAFRKLMGKNEGYYANRMDESDQGKVDVLTGAFMWMNKSKYMEIGGLDEDYFMYGEDIDLSYRFSKAGHQNYYIGTETILHYKGESTIKNTEYAKRFFGAMQLFYRKHFRSNLAMDLLVEHGLELVKFKNRWRSNGSFPPKQFQQVYLIAEGRPFFSKELEKMMGLKPILVAPEKIAEQKIEDALLVFDAGTISFRTIFGLMAKLKNKGNYFRIKPGNMDFIIGSDDSVHNGEVRFFCDLGK